MARSAALPRVLCGIENDEIQEHNKKGRKCGVSRVGPEQPSHLDVSSSTIYRSCLSNLSFSLRRSKHRLISCLFYIGFIMIWFWTCMLIKSAWSSPKRTPSCTRSSVMTSWRHEYDKGAPPSRQISHDQPFLWWHKQKGGGQGHG